MGTKLLNVTSEIGRLKEVLLHRPGLELENLTPEYLEEFLFDDIPFLKVAQEEHDAFAKILRDSGVTVTYIENLAAETLDTSEELKNKFIEDFLVEAEVHSESSRQYALKWLTGSFNSKQIVDMFIGGIRTNELPAHKDTSLAALASKSYPFFTKPLPNVLFTRDPFATIGHGVTINHMRTPIRRRETLFADYVFKYHPKYKGANVPRWFERDFTTSIEGGDELVINKRTLFVGISQRTDAASIETLAQKLFFNSETEFERILAFQIPPTRAFMHLDTVFTQIDHDKFTIHPGIEGDLTVYTLSKGAQGHSLKIEEERDSLQKVLERTLGRDVTLIRCGGGDKIAGDREQWNDGANTLAVAPGEVCVYSRNHVTNDLLQKHNIKIHVVPSSELSRGRGGPRCMSMPLVRDDI